MSDAYANIDALSLSPWAVLDALPSALAILDEAGTIRYRNQAWMELFSETNEPGLAPGGNFFAGLEAITEAGTEIGWLMATEVLAVLQGRRERFDLEYYCRLGQAERWLAAGIRPCRLNQAPAVIVQQRDISVRKQAEAERQAGEGRFRELFEHSPDAIYVEDLEGYVLDANPAACRLNGLAHEEIVGRHVLDLVPPQLREEVRLRLPEQVSGEQTVIESVSWHQDGHATPVEIRTAPILYADRPALLLHVRDITERKQYEALLRQREEQARRRQAVLLELARHPALASGNLKELLRAITRAAADELQVQRASVWLYRQQGSRLYCVELYDRARQSYHAGAEINEQDYPTYFAALKHERIIAADDVFSHRATSDFSHTYLQPLGISSLLDAQIRLGDQLIGAICHSHIGTPRQWTTEDERFATSIADLAALAHEIWQRRRAEQALQERNKTIELLQEVATAANESLSLDQALSRGIQLICHHTGWPVGHAYLVAEGQQRLLISLPIWHLDDSPRFEALHRITEATSFTSGVGLPGAALAARQPIWVEDVLREENFPRARLGQALGIRGAFAFPVLVGANVIAVLEFFSQRPEPPDHSLLKVLSSVGTQLGYVAERQRAEQEQARLKEAVIQAQAAALAELSTPMFPVSRDVVVMPLIGAIDTQRTGRIITTLLRGVAGQRAHIAIIDITGVTVVDRQVADALIRAAQAVRLLGCEVVLTGIRPEVAETLVGLGNTLQGVTTMSSLQNGIAYALTRRNTRPDGG